MVLTLKKKKATSKASYSADPSKKKAVHEWKLPTLAAYSHKTVCSKLSAPREKKGSESSLVLAHYVSGYVTKAEMSKMQEIWQEVSENKSVYSRLWSFGVRSLRFRECGLYEAFCSEITSTKSLTL